MKVLSVFIDHKINSELLEKHFNPIKIDAVNDKDKWVYAAVCNEIPDVVDFLKELARQGDFEVKVETEKFDEDYYYTSGDDYIVKKHIPVNEWSESGELNFLKYLFRDDYAITDKIKIT